MVGEGMQSVEKGKWIGNSKIAPFYALPWKLSENAIVEFSPAYALSSHKSAVC